MSQFSSEQQQALEWVRTVWGENYRCPVCNHSQWSVSEPMMIESMPPAANPFLVGQYRLVPVGCGNCGNTLLLNLALVQQTRGVG